MFDDNFGGANVDTPKTWWTYRFSVSKLMIVISDFFVIVWIGLIGYLFYCRIMALFEAVRSDSFHDIVVAFTKFNVASLITFFTFIFMILVLVFVKGSDDKTQKRQANQWIAMFLRGLKK